MTSWAARGQKCFYAGFGPIVISFRQPLSYLNFTGRESHQKQTLAKVYFVFNNLRTKSFLGLAEAVL